tara:strand:- start:208 stop:417 length:210 start_codon:yes stop_codon:yes gene_type:complete
MERVIKALGKLRDELISAAKYTTIPSHYDGGGALEQAVAHAKVEVLDAVSDAVNDTINQLVKELENNEK